MSVAECELIPLTPQEDFDFQTEDKIVRNTIKPTLACFAALERIRERKLWRGRFKSFDEYCKKRTGLAGHTINAKINAKHVRDALPIGKLQNDSQSQALGGFPSHLHVEIIEAVEAEDAGRGKITAAMIERIGKKVYEQHQPSMPSPIDDHEDDDESDENGHEEQATEAAAHVNRAVAERTAAPIRYAVERLRDHLRQGLCKGRKATPKDMTKPKVRATVKECRKLLTQIDELLTGLETSAALS